MDEAAIMNGASGAGGGGAWENPTGQGVYWIGSNGKVYVSGSQGTNDAGPADAQTDSYWQVRGFTPIADPNPGEVPATTNNVTSTGGGTQLSDAEAKKLAAETAERGKLKGDIGGYQDDIDALYTQLFSDLDTLVKARKGELEGQYGEQLAKAGEQYAGAIPEIETSYASIGAADSTDNTYAKVDAKKGFEDTTKTIGKNKSDDETALGKYATETTTKFQTDKDSATREIGRANETDDIDALRGARTNIETNLASGANTKATLGTDAGAKGKLKTITADAGRYESAVSALDEIVKSSMSGAVKQAAVKAVTDSAGLSDEEKQKVDEQYGNVYAEQAAL